MTVDLGRWEPLDRLEFPPRTHAGRGICCVPRCGGRAEWMRFSESTRLLGRRPVISVRGFAYCSPHAEWDTTRLAQRHLSDGVQRVYYAEKTDLIKIGMSRSVPSRVHALGAMLLATEPGGRDLERKRHRQFADLRSEGEWFRPGPDLLAHIAALPEQAVAA